jgi:hypothetical protein
MALGGGQKMGGLLGSDFADPRTQGILGLAGGLLSASGPSVGRPVSLGQALGSGLQMGQAAFNQAQQAKDVRDFRNEQFDYRKSRDLITDQRLADNTAYSRGRDEITDQRYLDELLYGRSRDAITDKRYSDELLYGRSRDVIADARAEAGLAIQEARLGIEENRLKAADAKSDADKAKLDFEQELKLRKLFTDGSKDYVEARTGFQKVANAVTNPNPTGANDIALIFGFMKTIDPRSVVREGEQATAQNAGGVSSKVRSLYNQVVDGQRLTDTQRQEFYEAAAGQFSAYVDRQTEHENQITALTSGYGLGVDNVVTSLLPKEGTAINPYRITDESQADRLPVGSYVLLTKGGQSTLNIVEED